ncbi:MAG: OmpA family protein [Flavobacteriales bacterium]
MKTKAYLLTLFACLTLGANAQRVQFPHKVEGSEAGAGKLKVWQAGYSKYAAAVLKENREGTTVKKPKKPKPGVIHYIFNPFRAQQLMVVESYNPGAIQKIEIGYKPSGKGKAIVKEIYSGTPGVTNEKYLRRNINFDETPNVTDVWIHMAYYDVDGVNQIGGIALCDFKDAFVPGINLADEEPFEGKPMHMNDDVSGKASPTTPIVTVDNQYIYFNHKNVSTNIYRGKIGNDGKFEKVERSHFNLPPGMATSTGIRSISQDNNTAWVTDFTVGKLLLYNVYLGKTLFGKPKWKYDKYEIKDYKNVSKYSNQIMSYDGKYLLVKQELADKTMSHFKDDIYVSIRNDKGKFGPLIRLGDDINTIGAELPCYLAPDNKTLFFASDGHYGYGNYDIFMSRRLDDTWQNWSYPINVGKSINTKEGENYFVIDGSASFAYFVRWDDGKDGSNLYRINIAKPKPQEVATEVPRKTITPEPIVMIKGIVYNKKTNEPMQADIVYENIKTGALAGSAISNAETGEYTIVLPRGVHYSFEANHEGFLSDRASKNTEGLTEYKELRQDFYLAPIEVGQTVRLNNIFFETAKAELLEESFLELNKLVKVLQDNPKVKIEISGHTDNVGNDGYNQKLSEQRAHSVVKYVVEKGISESRLSAKGYGKTKPVATNDTDEGKALNRRVEFTILEAKQ